MSRKNSVLGWSKPKKCRRISWYFYAYEHLKFHAQLSWAWNILWSRGLLLWRPICLPGPGCSKLTTSLVNASLNFQTVQTEICQYFLLNKAWEAFAVLLHCKSFSHIFNKNISVVGYKVVKLLPNWPLNELVKLTMLWTTGPWTLGRYTISFVWITAEFRVRFWRTISTKKYCFQPISHQVNTPEHQVRR